MKTNCCQHVNVKHQYAKVKSFFFYIFFNCAYKYAGEQIISCHPLDVYTCTYVQRPKRLEEINAFSVRFRSLNCLHRRGIIVGKFVGGVFIAARAGDTPPMHPAATTQADRRRAQFGRLYARLICQFPSVLQDESRRRHAQDPADKADSGRCVQSTR